MKEIIIPKKAKNNMKPKFIMNSSAETAGT